MPRRMLAFSIATVALMLGCSRTDPVSTDRAGTDAESAIRADASRIGGGFYPLVLGNRWRLSRVLTFEYMIWGDPPGPVEVIETTYDFAQICNEERSGNQYMIEEQRWQDSKGDTGTRWIRYRQDATGLYEADVSIADPPACVEADRASGIVPRHASEDLAWARLIQRLPESTRAAAQVKREEICARIEAALGSVRAPKTLAGENELTRLRYPLTPGQSWFVRSDLLAEVEAIEVLALPVGDVPAHRVRLTWVDFPDDLDILFWWGRCGQLAYSNRFEFFLIDDTGRPIGTVVSTEVAQVEDINLVDVRACTIAGE